MPRYYNPEASDFTLWLGKKLGNFYLSTKSLKDDEIEKAIQQFKKEGLLEKIDGMKYVLKNDCSRGHFWFDPRSRMNQYFPAFYNPENNKLIVCQNLIMDYPTLLENIVRETHFAELYKENALEQDEEYAVAAVQACKRGFSIYGSPEQMPTLMCAKLLLRYRGPNTDNVPFDAWIRLSDKLVKQKAYIFHAL